MKKKVLSVLLVSAMTASLFAGCGNNGGADAPAGTQGADNGAAAPTSHKLTVYAWDENFNIPALKAAEQDYKDVDPEFELEIVVQGSSQDVENAMTLAGEAFNNGDKKAFAELPDIVLFQDHYIQKYVNDYPDEWVAADQAKTDWSGLGAEKLSYSTIGGQHYGFPVDAGTCVMAYRTDALEAAGYTIDDVTGITWDEFIEIGKKVKEKTGLYLLCMDGSGNDLFYMMGQIEGVSQFKDGKPYITENQTMVDIFTVVCKMQEEGVLYLANSWSDYTDQAIQGDMVAGVFNGNWIIPTIKKVESNSGKWELTCAPSLTGAPGYASNGGSSLYITANCQDQALANDFLAYTFGGGSAADGVSTTYDLALLNGGVIGTCAAAAGSEVYQQGVEFFNNQAIYAKIVEDTQNVKTVEQNDFHYTCRTAMGTAVEKVKGGMSIEDALKEAEDTLTFEMQTAGAL